MEIGDKYTILMWDIFMEFEINEIEITQKELDEGYECIDEIVEESLPSNETSWRVIEDYEKKRIGENMIKIGQELTDTRLQKILRNKVKENKKNDK